MKKVLLCFNILIFVLSLAVSVFALDNKKEAEDKKQEAIDTDNIKYENSPMNKLSRGAINIITCWSEIPASVCSVSKEKDPFLGFTVGVVKGTFAAILRGMVGIFDTVTFAVPPYNKPLIKPEYSLKKADDKIKEYLW